MAPTGWTDGLDLDVPNVARIYDYWLGGSHNFAVDRQAGEKVLQAQPGIRYMARANRAFVRRAVRHLAAAGVTQFLDLGSGIPTVDSVHGLAQAIAPDARVLYVDNDPMAVIHSAHLVAGNPTADVLCGDVAEVCQRLDDARVRAVIDFSQPVAVLAASILNFLPRDAAPQAVDNLRGALTPGSYLAISHVCPEAFSAEQRERLRAIYRRTASTGGYGARTWDEIHRFFDGFELVDPGLVWIPQWRPEPGDVIPDNPACAGFLAAVGRKETGDRG